MVPSLKPNSLFATATDTQFSQRWSINDSSKRQLCSL